MLLQIEREIRRACSAQHGTKPRASPPTSRIRLGEKEGFFFSPGLHKQLWPSKARSHIALSLLDLHKPHLMLFNAIIIQIAKDHPCWVPRFEDHLILRQHTLLVLTHRPIQTH